MALTVFSLVILLTFGNPFGSSDYTELDAAIAQIPQDDIQDVNGDESLDDNVPEIIDEDDGQTPVDDQETSQDDG